MSYIDLILPELGMGDRLVKVSLWLVDQGAPVSLGQPVVEILVDSATVDLPSPTDGYLTRKVVREDEHIEVGQRLAVFENASLDAPSPEESI